MPPSKLPVVCGRKSLCSTSNQTTLPIVCCVSRLKNTLSHPRNAHKLPPPKICFNVHVSLMHDPTVSWARIVPCSLTHCNRGVWGEPWLCPPDLPGDGPKVWRKRGRAGASELLSCAAEASTKVVWKNRRARRARVCICQTAFWSFFWGDCC